MPGKVDELERERLRRYEAELRRVDLAITEAFKRDYNQRAWRPVLAEAQLRIRNLVGEGTR